MQLIIISHDKELKKTLLPVLDDLIQGRRRSRLELYSYQTFPLQSLEFLEQHRHYYFLLDIRGSANALKDAEYLHRIFPFSQIGILSDNDSFFLQLCNRLFFLQGYLNLKHLQWIQELETLLSSLDKQTQSTKDAFIISKKYEEYVVPFNSIYYIETVKGTHNCKISGSAAAPEFRGNIYEIVTQLDSRFSIVRSSTIANLSLVMKINRIEKLLVFNSHSSCSFAQKYYPCIREKIRKGSFA